MATSIAIPKIVSAFPVNTQTVWVRKDGSDTNGNGSDNNPYLTIAKALTSITDAAPAKPYTIMVGAGSYDESSLALKGNVYLVGCGGPEELSCRVGVTGNMVTLDSTYAAVNGSRSGIKNIGFKGTTGLNADISALSSPNNTILVLNNCSFNGSVTFKSGASGDGFEWFGGLCLGTLNISGGTTGSLHDLIIIGAVTFADCSASQFQSVMLSCTLSAGMTLTGSNSGKSSYVQLFGCSISDITMTQGAGTTVTAYIDSPSYPYNSFTLNSGQVYKMTDVKTVSWNVDTRATAAGTTVLNSFSNTVQVFTGSTTQSVTLPAASLFGATTGQMLIIKNMSSGTITINRAGSDTIDGATSVSLLGGEKSSVTLMCDGVSAWFIL